MEKPTKFCKESGKPIINGKCVCPSKKQKHNCECTDHIDIMQIIPFIIHNASFYKEGIR